MGIADWATSKGGKPGLSSSRGHFARWLSKLSGSRVQRALDALAEIPPAPGRKHHILHPFPFLDKQAYKDKHSNEEIHAAIEHAPVVEVPLDTLASIQHTVTPHTVAEYIRTGCFVPPGTRSPKHGGLIDHPIVIQQDGIRYVHDGNNRCTAAALLGATRWPVRFVDFDAKGGADGRDDGEVPAA
jgi:hypothetical protein